MVNRKTDCCNVLGVILQQPDFFIKLDNRKKCVIGGIVEGLLGRLFQIFCRARHAAAGIQDQDDVNRYIGFLHRHIDCVIGAGQVNSGGLGDGFKYRQAGLWIIDVVVHLQRHRVRGFDGRNLTQSNRQTRLGMNRKDRRRNQHGHKNDKEELFPNPHHAFLSKTTILDNVYPNYNK